MMVALLALVVALGGTAFAAVALVKGDKLIKKGSLSGNRLRKHTITGTQVNLSKLGKVPSATNADSATSATNAGHATNATNATNATDATDASFAANSGELGGVTASSYVQQSSLSGGSFTDAPGVVNGSLASSCITAGTPNAWVDRSSNVNFTVGYVRDAAGFVHLEGTAFRCGTAGTTIFTLPAGFRPARLAHAVGVDSTAGEVATVITVSSNGDVTAPNVATNDSASVDGLTFRCGPSGSNGCP
jgi:hypothetical protein